MEKTDFKKSQPDLYAPKRSWTLVDVPPMQFVAISGKGNPNQSEEYAAVISALYALSFTAKFASKTNLGRDYVVLPLEGLWAAENQAVFEVANKDQYQWTMMIRQPDWIEPDLLNQAQIEAQQKKPQLPWDRLHIMNLHEGPSLQMLHIGSYDDEAPLLAELHNTILPEMNQVENGLHHEIYLGDPRRVAPERLKTILRQPVTSRQN